MTFEIDRPGQDPLRQVMSAWMVLTAFATLAFVVSVI